MFFFRLLSYPNSYLGIRCHVKRFVVENSYSTVWLKFSVGFRNYANHLWRARQNGISQQLNYSPLFKNVCLLLWISYLKVRVKHLSAPDKSRQRQVTSYLTSGDKQDVMISTPSFYLKLNLTVCNVSFIKYCLSNLTFLQSNSANQILFCFSTFYNNQHSHVDGG